MRHRILFFWLVAGMVVIRCMAGEFSGPELDTDFGVGGSAKAEKMAVKTEEKKPETPKNNETALEFEKKGDFKAALEIYEAVMNSGVKGGELLVARFGAGRCLAETGRDWEAFGLIEQSFPLELEQLKVAARVEVEVAIAKRFMAAGKTICEGAVDGKKKMTGYEAASRVLKAIVYNDPRSKHAAWAMLADGDCLVEAGDLQGARDAYELAIQSFSPRLEGYLARASLASVLIHSRKESGVADKSYEKAAALVNECELYGLKAPELVSRVEKVGKTKVECMAEDMLDKARFYLRRGSRRSVKAGIFVLKDLVRIYPDTAASKDAKSLLARHGVTLTDEKPEQKNG